MAVSQNDLNNAYLIGQRGGYIDPNKPMYHEDRLKLQHQVERGRKGL